MPCEKFIPEDAQRDECAGCGWAEMHHAAPPPDSLEKWAEDAAEFLARTVQAPDLLARARALGVGK